MGKSNWQDIILGGETSTLQFKREKINGNALAAELAAFANSRGGTLLFGVDDKNGTPVGLD